MKILRNKQHKLHNVIKLFGNVKIANFIMILNNQKYVEILNVILVLNKSKIISYFK